MFKLKSSIIKELRLLSRDRVGLLLMFIMPVFLAIVMTAIQDSTFKLVNDNKMSLVICNRDDDDTADEFIEALQNTGLFSVSVTDVAGDDALKKFSKDKNALATLIIPKGMFKDIKQKASIKANKALVDFGISDSVKDAPHHDTTAMLMKVIFKPVLQDTYRYSVKASINSIVQIITNKLMIRFLYSDINQKEITTEMEEQMLPEDVTVEEIADNKTSHGMPSATQHNIPAWTLFAMFFSVISLGGNIVKEKLSGSFTRLKVLPTSYAVALISKQAVYLLVALVQVAVIFSIGIWLFPLFGLPALDIPHDVLGLLVISLICGWCAISYALCIGVFAQTQEQANGFGSASVVILAAIGGIFVPSFAMPESFKALLSISPFHWGLQSYYGLFLENLPLVQIILNILPLLVSIFVLQTISFIGLKRKNLI